MDTQVEKHLLDLGRVALSRPNVNWVMSIFETTGDLPGNNLPANYVVKYRGQSFSDPFPPASGPTSVTSGGRCITT